MTIFSKIISKEIESDIVYEDDKVIAFRDINPKAKVHIIVIPKIEIVDLDHLDSSNIKYISAIFLAIPKIAKIESLSQGYKLISNCKEHGGQEIKHLHFHILGGEKVDSCLV